MTPNLLIGGTQGVGGVTGDAGSLGGNVTISERLAVNEAQNTTLFGVASPSAQVGLTTKLGGSCYVTLNHQVLFQGTLGSVWTALLAEITAIISEPRMGVSGLTLTEGLHFSGTPAEFTRISPTLTQAIGCHAALLSGRVAPVNFTETPGFLADAAGHKGFFETLADSAWVAESAILQRAALQSITDSITLPSALVVKLLSTGLLSDQAAISETLLGQLITRLAEKVKVKGLFGSTANQHVGLSERITLTDLLTIIFELLVAEPIGFMGSPISISKRFEEVVDALVQSDSSLSQVLAAQLVSAAILLNDEALRYFERSAADTLSTLANLSSSLFALNALTEAAALSSQAAGSLTVISVVEDTAAASGGADSNRLTNASLLDEVKFLTVELKVNGEAYLGWILNTESTGLTQYDQYPFNSLTRFGNRYLGAGEMGICELSGDTDNGQLIAAQLKTGVTDFGSPMKKRIDRAYLGITSEGDILLKVTSDKGVEDWYSLSPRTGDIHTERVKLGKGVKSRYWQFELTNSEGAHFELESLELVPIILSRRL